MWLKFFFLSLENINVHVLLQNIELNLMFNNKTKNLKRWNFVDKK